MTFVELFAGIGGFSLGFERAGHECVGHVEIDKYAQKVLLKHWPDVKLMSDVKEVKGNEFGKIDILCGGFPCQDLSVAGKQKGIHGERSGLYDEIIRIAGFCRPKYIVLENVANLLSRPEWFGYVLGRLAQIGYNVEWEIISAKDVGAPHLRKRIWIVAYPINNTDRTFSGPEKKTEEIQGINREKRRCGMPSRTGSNPEDVADSSSEFSNGIKDNTRELQQSEKVSEPGNGSGSENVADTDKKGLQRQLQHGQRNRNSGRFSLACESVSGRKIKRSNFWATEPELGRVANGIPNRVDRLKCLGNALVPQIAEFIGRQLF